MTMIVYDAATGDIKEKKDKIHTGSVYSLAFFDGGKKFVTCSADKTLKIWKWEGLQLLHTLNINAKPQVDDMQVGVTVTDQHIISLSLNGVFNFWNLDQLEGEVIDAPHFVQGLHRKNIVQVWYSEGKLLSIDTDGRVLKFESLSQIATHHDLGKSVKNAKFTKCGKFVAISSSDSIIVYSTDDFKELSETKADGFINDLFILSATKVAAVTNKSTFTVFDEGNACTTIALGEEGTCIDMSNDGSSAYVGGLKGTFFKISVAESTMAFKENFSQKVTCIKISNNNNIVCIGAGNGTVGFYSNVENAIVSKTLKYHGNFITSIVFNADDTKVATSAYESAVYTWDVVTLKKADKITTAGHRGAINQLVKTDTGFISIGTDVSIKKWEYKL